MGETSTWRGIERNAIMVYTAEPGTEDAERLALAIVLGTQTLVE
jgi:hypothetical protein